MAKPKHKTITLREYLRLLTPAGRRDFAKRCGCSLSNLYKIAGQHRQAGVDLAKAIVQESNQMVGPSCLRFLDNPVTAHVDLPPALRGRKKGGHSEQISYTDTDTVHETQGEVA
ncbi:hypothetical protein [Burkholderia vietnamiensis]|uniref:hypothetical protein n=1 Tax=Burkholderia vietnamiensis TaxID=60552 RepID=UPI0006232D8C|nr:hypothetical protein [Burkholderia vietnamiensis]MBR8189233.1 hypothetical protein [Burkholderia vietnamiensis]HDR9174438.1 hypothetical protein [Burkholderia vietnamiensis]